MVDSGKGFWRHIPEHRWNAMKGWSTRKKAAIILGTGTGLALIAKRKRIKEKWGSWKKQNEEYERQNAILTEVNDTLSDILNTYSSNQLQIENEFNEGLIRLRKQYSGKKMPTAMMRQLNRQYASSMKANKNMAIRDVQRLDDQTHKNYGISIINVDDAVRQLQPFSGSAQASELDRYERIISDLATTLGIALTLHGLYKRFREGRRQKVNFESFRKVASGG